MLSRKSVPESTFKENILEILYTYCSENGSTFLPIGKIFADFSQYFFKQVRTCVCFCVLYMLYFVVQIRRLNHMLKDFDLQVLTQPLLQWYAGHARTLPWRENITPYRVWVSEIMLQ